MIYVWCRIFNRGLRRFLPTLTRNLGVSWKRGLPPIICLTRNSERIPLLCALWQGELVDRIEYCVTQTSDHVGQARGELIKAGEYKTKARKVINQRLFKIHR